MLEFLLRDAFLLIALVSGVPLLVSSCSGLLLSVFQASTQIQEQSIQFILKLVSISTAFYFFGDFFVSQLISFFEECLREIPKLGVL